METKKRKSRWDKEPSQKSPSPPKKGKFERYASTSDEEDIFIFGKPQIIHNVPLDVVEKSPQAPTPAMAKARKVADDIMRKRRQEQLGLLKKSPPPPQRLMMDSSPKPSSSARPLSKTPVKKCSPKPASPMKGPLPKTPVKKSSPKPPSPMKKSPPKVSKLKPSSTVTKGKATPKTSKQKLSPKTRKNATPGRKPMNLDHASTKKSATPKPRSTTPKKTTPKSSPKGTKLKKTPEPRAVMETSSEPFIFGRTSPKSLKSMFTIKAKSKTTESVMTPPRKVILEAAGNPSPMRTFLLAASLPKATMQKKTSPLKSKGKGSKKTKTYKGNKWVEVAIGPDCGSPSFKPKTKRARKSKKNKRGKRLASPRPVQSPEELSPESDSTIIMKGTPKRPIKMELVFRYYSRTGEVIEDCHWVTRYGQ
ncbi:unnamed protein product [Owenia fusiformis]|uniref:Uncharacterized protein n=1 Tax=Owenia fusiformis TaxID=6347 RepID=A0A8J1TBA7_OWEFU|nr:unnamed protein product [Owenia fusiformis]